MLDSLLAGVMLFSSFAARTPNVQPNPDDYEVSLGFSHKNVYVNRQWERELGSFYVDDLVWAKLEDGVYFKPEYMNKESRDVKYLKLDWRKSWVGMTWGFTTRSITDDLDMYETFASVGYTNKKTYWEKVDVEFSFDGYLPPDDSGDTDLKNFEFENKFKTSWKLSDKIRLYNLGEVSKLKGNQFYKAKVGIEYVF
tara:strand:+ start:101 stop:688 length:588 start_codon:yes stop_codon:yes gene_type:complete